MAKGHKMSEAKKDGPGASRRKSKMPATEENNAGKFLYRSI